MASEKLQSFGGLDCRTCGRGHGQAGLAARKFSFIEQKLYFCLRLKNQ